MTYYIPENFIEGGRLFGGMLKTRNFIEAIALSIIVGFPLWIIPYPSISIKITVLISVLMPIFLIATAGINGDSLLEFIKQYHDWRTNKRIIIYNNKANPRSLRPADIVLAQELPKDKIVDAFDKWKENKKNKKIQITFIEGEDFVFQEDELENSSYITTEKKLLGLDGNDIKLKKKKRNKNKNTPLLQETNIQQNISKFQDNSTDEPEEETADIIINEEDITDVE